MQLCFSGSNSVWTVGDDWILNQWRNGKWQPGPRLQKTGFRFDRVFETKNGQLWSQTYPHGLARFEADQWRLFGPENGLPKSYITAVLDEGEEGLLCATYEQGLFLFRDDHASPAGLNRNLPKWMACFHCSGTNWGMFGPAPGVEVCCGCAARGCKSFAEAIARASQGWRSIIATASGSAVARDYGLGRRKICGGATAGGPAKI